MGYTLWKSAVFETMKKFVFIVKKKFVFFQSKTSLNLICIFFFDRKQIKIKIAFFDQKHGLIPLEKCDF